VVHKNMFSLYFGTCLWRIKSICRNHFQVSRNQVWHMPLLIDEL
jgi:hypothetical protein